MSNNSFLIDFANIGLYFTPFVAFVAYAAAYKKGRTYGGFYNESDDYLLIETDSNKATSQTRKLQKTVIKKIKTLGLKGIRAKSLRCYAVGRIGDTQNKDCEIIAHGVFSLDNQLGLKNILLLLAKLWAENKIYFSKISFFNVNFYYKELNIVDSTFMSIFQFALMSKVFWYKVKKIKF